MAIPNRLYGDHRGRLPVGSGSLRTESGALSEVGSVSDAVQSIVRAVTLVFLAAIGHPEVGAQVVGAGVMVQAPPDMRAAQPGIAIIVIVIIIIIIIVVCTEAADDQGQEQI